MAIYGNKSGYSKLVISNRQSFYKGVTNKSFSIESTIKVANN